MRLERKRDACAHAALILREHHQAAIQQVRPVSFREQVIQVKQRLDIKAFVVRGDRLAQMKIQIGLNPAD